MKLLFSFVVVALPACTSSACTTLARQPVAAMSESRSTLGTVTITGDQLKQTGRTQLPDALRASSPIFH